MAYRKKRKGGWFGAALISKYIFLRGTARLRSRRCGARSISSDHYWFHRGVEILKSPIRGAPLMAMVAGFVSILPKSRGTRGPVSCGSASRQVSRSVNVKLASKRFLAGSLGLAAGVMLYVSLVDLFSESVEFYEASGFDEADAYLYGTLSLFGGMLVYKCIDFVVHIMEGENDSHNVDIYLYDLDQTSGAKTKEKNIHGAIAGTAPSEDDSAEAGTVDHRAPRSSREFPRDHNVVVELGSGSTIQPSADLHTLQLSMAGKVQPSIQPHHQEEKSPVSAMTPEDQTASGEALSAIEEGKGEGTAQKREVDKRLVRMGLMTALAIGIHNFPEGLATFVATLSDAYVGAALAVAIAIHNIPEGLCVAIPVYYATGNRMKAFGWAFLSGISEPIGAGIGWLILKDEMTDQVFGILFGLVGGMMVMISLQELIPTAVRYDPTDKVTTNTIFIGMAVMALSIVLFHY